MKLIINGEERVFEGVSNVAELIDKLGIKGDRVAVELNRDIVPRAQWRAAALKDGDKLEVVHFVGGGSEPFGNLPNDKAGPAEMEMAQEP